MKKGKVIFVFLLIIAIISLFVIVNNVPEGRMLNDYYSKTGIAFSLVAQGNGNEYYEERCIDVQDYLNDGYELDGTDENGCDLVSKPVAVTSQIRYNKCGRSYAPDKMCRKLFGDDWAADGCGGGRHDSYFSKCSVFIDDIKGGQEKILNTCSFDQNDMLVAETFTGNQVITKNNLRYPIKGFCKAHPSIITNDALKQSSTSTNIMQQLIDNQEVSIGPDETMTIFYSIENNDNLPTICDSGNNLAYNVETGVCSSTLGFTYLCSEGVFDALQGVCVVQPESTNVCDKGRYDTTLDQCIYNPPINVDCGGDNCYYSLAQDTCVCPMTDIFNCDSSFSLFYPTQDKCENEGNTWLTCPQCEDDEICPTSVCEPRCDSGVVCKSNYNPLVDYCVAQGDITSTNNRGKCEIYGNVTEPDSEDNCPSGYSLRNNKCKEVIDRFALCEDGLTYSSSTRTCDKAPELNVVCPENSLPRYNSGKNIVECINSPEKFVECDVGYLYNSNLDICVKNIQIYEPNRDDILLYTEIESGCTSDSECNVYGDDIVCNSELGICHTDVTKAKALLVIKQQLIDQYDAEYQVLQDVYEQRINSYLSDIESKAEYIKSLNATVQEMANIINNFELTLTEQEQLVNELSLKADEQKQLIAELSGLVTLQGEQILDMENYINQQANNIQALGLTIEEQAEYISNLNLEVVDQVSLINRLGLTIEEQAEYINELNLEVEDQANLINELTTNLNDKAYLISQLTAENDEQARLLSLMRESFANQGVILDQLNLELEDDARIINELTNNNNDMSQIIDGMNLNIEEQSLIIQELTTNNNDMAEIIDGLNLNIQQQTLLIQSLKKTNQEQASLLNEMELTVDEMIQTIELLNLNKDEMASVIGELSLSNTELQKMVEELSNNIEDQQELVAKISDYKSELEKTKLNNRLLIVAVSIVSIISLVLIFKKNKTKKSKKRRK